MREIKCFGRRFPYKLYQESETSYLISPPNHMLHPFFPVYGGRRICILSLYVQLRVSTNIAVQRYAYLHTDVLYGGFVGRFSPDGAKTFLSGITGRLLYYATV